MFRLLFVVIMLPLAGCFNSHVKYYSLQDGTLGAPIPSQVSSNTMLVGIGPISLPKLINRPQLVVRQSSSEFVFEELHQWGGRLQEDVGLVLVSRLQASHPKDAVYPYPADARPVPTHQWAVDIQQLDGQLGGPVMLQASCRLVEKATRQLVFQRQVTRTLVAVDMQMSSYVAAQRQLMFELADACAW